MEFAAVSGRLEAIEREDSDTGTTALVAELLREAADDLPAVVRVLLGRVAPAHESTTLDVGPQLCYEALARAAGQNVTAEDVEARLAERGEIGAVAASYDLGGQRGLDAFASGGEEDSLSVAELVDRLHSIAAASGSGSQDTKVDALFGLFSRLRERETRYLARLVLSEMRLGVGEGTIRDAIAEAFGVPVETVERALQVSNDYGLVAETARDEGESGLAAIRLKVGRPVKPMLAQAGTVGDALAWGDIAVEWKYDGARVQVHYDGADVRLYSRNTEDVTDPLPDIVATVREQLDVPAILDCEVVAVDDEGNPRPFQAVLRRFRRKHDVAQAQEDVKLQLYAFDCLHANGEDLLDEPLVERHAHLDSLLDAVSPLVVTDDRDEIESQEQAALAAGHEGIMLKNPDAAYTPGRRGQNWLKRKPDVETLDCVVTGAEWGEGRRATLFGTFELSVQDGDGYATVGKVATGITDEQLEALTERLESHVRAEDGTEVDIAPAVVFEVGYEEIQTSPTYSAGYALRFPRFLGVREDKAPEDADTLARVERLAEG